ncbi:MAG: hypothetical protein OHK0046_21480 [Anaerolineae bacterium]
MTILEVLGVAAMGIGLFFYIFGIIGLVRFPDVYSRIHAAGKVSGMGIIFFALALALLNPETTLKAIMLAVFMIITQPVASHAIASAAQRSGVPLKNASRNDLTASH